MLLVHSSNYRKHCARVDAYWSKHYGNRPALRAFVLRNSRQSDFRQSEQSVSISGNEG